MIPSPLPSALTDEAADVGETPVLCLQRQLDLADLAQPLLILPARRGTAEKLPQGVDQTGISY